MFKAILVEKGPRGTTARLADLDDAQLPDADVTVRVEYSTLNYKDGLALTGRAPVVRKFPMVPGIDLAGTVESSRAPGFTAGDRVVLNGWGLGETHFGGLAQRARVGAEALVEIPAPFGTREAAAIGTAGFTAMLCVLALERHGVTPASGEVLVTGAAGGVGSVAIALLARRGYQVVASTGRASETGYLTRLGAARVVDRAELAGVGKPLGPERWAGVVDAVGSHTLANACAQTRIGGAVCACGNASGMDFPSTVAPFILRGITLYGIDSVRASPAQRKQAWSRLASDLDRRLLTEMTREIGLEDALAAGKDILDGKVRGRLVVDVSRLRA
jgi:acrylyl-CoA reductase (NADPH)